ncbi:MAG: hypothetical protein QXI77_00330 [Nanopusillaceae archaeon]
MNPIKKSIIFLLKIKCEICQDKSFCKVKQYYSKMDNPTVKDLQNLNKCLFYKKEPISNKLKLKNIW